MKVKILHKVWIAIKPVKGDNYTTYLPSEIWSKILGYLSVNDLCQVMLVSRFINSVARDPRLWTGAEISGTKVWSVLCAEKNEGIFWENFGGLFEIDRFSQIQKLDLYLIFRQYNFIADKNDDACTRETTIGGDVTQSSPEEVLPTCLKFAFRHLSLNTDIFSLILTYKSIKNLNLKELYLVDVASDILATGLTQFCEVDLSGANITPEQLTAFFLASVNSSTLHTVNLARLNLQDVNPNVLGMVVVQPVDVNLSFTKLTSDQLASLLRGVILSRRLESLHLVGIDLSLVDAKLMSIAFTQLRRLTLGGATLIRLIPAAHLNQFFTRCLETSNLKEVNLDRLNLEQVDSETLGKAIGKFNKAILSGTRLCLLQLNSILIHCISSMSLQELHLDEINLSAVDPDLLAEAVSQTSIVWLGGTILSSDQPSAIFSRIAAEGSCIKELSLCGVNLAAVEPQILAAGVSNLEAADLTATRLTKSQVKALLDAVKTSHTIKLLNLKNVSNAEEVGVVQFKKAAKNRRFIIQI